MKAGCLFNWRGLWVGAHYSTFNKRLCVNLIPYVSGADTAKCAMKFRVLGGANWSGWKELWTSDRLPVGAVGRDVVAAATQEAARTALGVPLSKEFTSTQYTFTAAGLLTIPHGLGVRPKLVSASLVCQIAEFGYTVGDELLYPTAGTDASGGTGLSVVLDATNLNVRMGSGNFIILNKVTGITTYFTPANWRLVLRAWA